MIEDLHWADAASLELLAYLGPRLATMRALVLASFRPDEVLPESAVAAAIAKIERASSAGRIDLVPLRGTEFRRFPDCEVTRGNVLTLLAVAKHRWPKDRVRARELLAQAAQALVEIPERAALALFDAIEHERGGRRAQALACASAAAEGFRRMRMPLLEAWALEASGDPAAALELYRRCGASADVRRLTGGASASASTFSMLSKREHEIAALAVRGRSNLEIARELSISHKTVEKHLASAFRKLGIASRRELHDVSGFDRALASTATYILESKFHDVRFGPGLSARAFRGHPDKRIRLRSLRSSRFQKGLTDMMDAMHELDPRSERPPHANFSRVLRRLRVAAGLSQQALADRAGISAKAVSALECGLRRAPYRATAEALARALNLSGDQQIEFSAAWSFNRRRPRVVAFPRRGNVARLTLCLTLTLDPAATSNVIDVQIREATIRRECEEIENVS